MAVQDFLGVGALRDVGAALGGSFVRLHIRAGDSCGKVNGGSAPSERRLVHAITSVKQSGSPHGSKIPLHEAVF
jgi:hypothetical protein